MKMFICQIPAADPFAVLARLLKVRDLAVPDTLTTRGFRRSFWAATELERSCNGPPGIVATVKTQISVGVHERTRSRTVEFGRHNPACRDSGVLAGRFRFQNVAALAMTHVGQR